MADLLDEVLTAQVKVQRLLSDAWVTLPEAQCRWVYVQAARRVLPITQAYFPLLPYPTQALRQAELAMLGVANVRARYALYREYKNKAPTMHELREGRCEGEVYHKRLAAIYANEACLHAASGNMVEQYLSYAYNACLCDVMGGYKQYEQAPALICETVKYQEILAQWHDVQQLLTPDL